MKKSGLVRAKLLLPLVVGLMAASGAASANIANNPAVAARPSSLASLRAEEIRLRNAIDQTPQNGMLRIQLARVYLQLGNFNGGLAELTVARQLKVSDETIAPLQAQLMNAAGSFPDLLHEIPEGNRPPKTESAVRTYRALAQMAIGEMDNAAASLRDAERLDGSNTVAKLAAARLLLGQKQAKLAEQKVDQVLAVAPADAAALELKGLILQQRGDTNGALGYFNKAIATGHANVQILLDRANLEASRNQLDLAAKDLAIVKAAVPNSPMAAYVDAVVKARSGNFKAADEALDKVRPAMAYFHGAYLLAGQIKFKLNQLAQAEEYLTKFIAQDQSQPGAYAMLGAIALQRGDTQRAVSMLEKAQGLTPQDAGTAIVLSQAYLAHGDAAKAAALMDQMSARQPNNPNLEAQRSLAHFAAGESGGNLAQLDALFKSGKLTAGPSLIQAQLRAGNAAAAGKTAQELVKREPANLLYKELLGATLVAQRNYGAAEGVFKDILAKQPSLLAARRSLAQIYFTTNRPDAAMALLQDWVAKNPGSAAARQMLAEAYASRKDYASAIKLLKDPAVAKSPDPGPGLMLVRLYENQSQWPDAIKAANDLQARFPNNLAILDTLGRLYSRSGDSKASVAAYAKATAAFPNAAWLWNNYATALAASKNASGALDAIGKAHTLAPDNLQYERGLVDLTYALKGQAAATAVAQSFKNNTPQNPVGVMMLAATLERNGKRADAIALLEATQAKSPSANGAMLLAKFYVADQKLPKAIGAVEAWTKTHPDDFQARNGLAQLYGSAGNLAQAQQQFEWLDAHRPNDPATLNNLAWLYSQKNDPRAQATAEKAFKLAPQSGPIADTLGWILQGHGDTAGALKYLQLAVAASPDDPAIRYHLAVAFAKANQPANARPNLQKVLQSNAATPDIKQQAKTLLTKIGS